MDSGSSGDGRVVQTPARDRPEANALGPVRAERGRLLRTLSANMRAADEEEEDEEDEVDEEDEEDNDVDDDDEEEEEEEQWGVTGTQIPWPTDEARNNAIQETKRSMNGFTGKVEIPDDYVSPTEEECTRQHQENHFDRIKLEEEYNACSLAEQKRIRETENERRAHIHGAQYEEIGDDDDAIGAYVDLQQDGLVPPIEVIITRLEAFILYCLRVSLLCHTPYMQSPSMSDYHVCGVTGCIMKRFKNAYFSRRRGYDRRWRSITIECEEYDRVWGTNFHETLFDVWDAVDHGAQYPGFKAEVDKLRFNSPSAANMCEYLLQNYLWRKGYNIDFAGNLRQGGVTIKSHDADVNDRTIWSVYLMIFKSGVANVHRLRPIGEDEELPPEDDDVPARRLRLGPRLCDDEFDDEFYGVQWDEYELDE